MTRVHLVRHANRADSEPGDPGISDVGARQAQATSRALCAVGPPVVEIHTSPLRRARKTARLVAPTLTPRIDARLRERANWGDVAGQSREAFVSLWRRCSADRDYAPPQGDSSRAAGRRLEAFVRAQHAPGRSRRIVAVTHGGILADFLLNAFDARELTDANAAFAADPWSGEIVRECSITTIDVEDERLSLVALAEADHLLG